MIVGIDLGTTNSLVGCFRDGAVQLIPNALGHLLTPSAVSLGSDGEVLVGLSARERMTLHPERTATAFKRWMGSDRLLRLGEREFRPEELSALVLRTLKADAEAWLGEPVTEAVITVPAYFNEAQRKATKAAGELAGFKVERLLNEPTAAGLAYGLQERPDHTLFLVFDLGGGTFDVSVLEYFEGVVEVRASAGDTRLGGEDFVAVLSEHLLDKADGLSTRERERLRQRNGLWRVAEQLKRDLSDAEEAAAHFSVDGGKAIEARVSRTTFEQLAAPLLQRMRRPIERALADAKLVPSQLAEVVLVGGATRMPMVRQMVTRLFQRLPLRLINPDEAIARGAAVQAALKARDAALDEVVLTDVMPYSLGLVTLQVMNGQRVPDVYSPLIERNTPVPVSRLGTYYTVSDDQTTVKLDVRQGESPVGSENLQVATLDVPVPPRPAGEVAIDVRFTYDVNGLLEIDVHERGTDRKINRVVQASGTALSDEQIVQTRERLKALKVHPREQAENRYVLERAKRLYEDRLNARQRIQPLLSAFELALQAQEPRLIEARRAVLTQLLDQVDKGFVL
jgi:molecular chaperone HscC